MFPWLKKFVQTKLFQFFVSVCIVYTIFYCLALLHKDVHSIKKESLKPTSFFKIHQPKTIKVNQPKKSKSVKKKEVKPISSSILEQIKSSKKSELENKDVDEDETQESSEKIAPTDLSQVDDAVPVLLQSIRPRYPEVAKKAAVEANVLLELIIDEKGKVIFAHIIYCSQPGYGFEQSAMQAAKKLNFKPFTKDGKVTKVKITYPINYKLI
jgi:protein TonB